jgi:uncharacterized protein (DUF1786 family)
MSGVAEGAVGGAMDASEPSRPMRVLAVDVGTGTADVLLTRPGQPLENAVRLVVPSRTQVVGALIREATARGQTVLFTGPVMGGGASGMAMKAHLRAGHSFVATEQAALTFADDLDRVRDAGVRVVDDGTARELRERLPTGALAVVDSGDLEPRTLRQALALLGAEPVFDAVAVAVQDHGFTPHGSNRVFRFELWEQAVAERRLITDLFYRGDSAPAALTRLRAAAALARQLAGVGSTLVADTGPAALYGARRTPRATRYL